MSQSQSRGQQVQQGSVQQARVQQSQQNRNVIPDADTSIDLRNIPRSDRRSSSAASSAGFVEQKTRKNKFLLNDELYYAHIGVSKFFIKKPSRKLSKDDINTVKRHLKGSDYTLISKKKLLADTQNRMLCYDLFKVCSAFTSMNEAVRVEVEKVTNKSEELTRLMENMRLMTRTIRHECTVLSAVGKVERNKPLILSNVISSSLETSTLRLKGSEEIRTTTDGNMYPTFVPGEGVRDILGEVHENQRLFKESIGIIDESVTNGSTVGDVFGRVSRLGITSGITALFVADMILRASDFNPQNRADYISNVCKVVLLKPTMLGDRNLILPASNARMSSTNNADVSFDAIGDEM